MRARSRFRCFVCRRTYEMPLYPEGVNADGEQCCHGCMDLSRDEAIEIAVDYRREQAGRELLDWVDVDTWRAANLVRRMLRDGIDVESDEYKAERAAVAAADAEDAADERAAVASVMRDAMSRGHAVHEAAAAVMRELATVEGRG